MTTSNPCSPRQMCRASGSDCLLLDPAGAHFTLGPRQRGYFAARRKFADIPPSPARHTAKRSFVVITSSRQTRRLLRTDYSVPSPRQNAAGAMRNVCDGTSSSCFEVQPPRRERNIGRRRRRSSIAARQAVGKRQNQVRSVDFSGVVYAMHLQRSSERSCRYARSVHNDSMHDSTRPVS